MKYVKSFLGSFLIVSLIVVCNFQLFFYVQSAKEGEDYGVAAFVCLNVFFIALIFTVIDAVRKYYLVEQPLKHILKIIEQMKNGRFDKKIELDSGKNKKDDLTLIAHGMNDLAEQLSNVKVLRADYLSITSHELKTPLAVIQNYASLLKMEEISEEKRIEYANAIVNQVKQVSHLITNNLRISKLENQFIYPDSKSYNLGEQLCEVMLAFEDEWEKKQIDITVDLEEDVMVYADPDWMSIVWNNLISNALKYTPSGGQIGLFLKTEGEDALVTVCDTGCGMTEKVKERIFQKFYQGDKSRASGGNGLGLAIVSSVLKAEKGTIEVESEPGKGSRFTVRLKVHK